MRSGDGWSVCDQGHRHWGRFGAAGLLLIRPGSIRPGSIRPGSIRGGSIRPGSIGPGQVFLQLRSAYIHHGGTWSIPGGARDSHESPVQASMREAREEIGLLTGNVEIVGEFVDDHGGWSYTTVFGHPIGEPELLHNHESTEMAWVPIDAVPELPLHPGFRISWPLVEALVHEYLDGGSPERPSTWG